MKHSRALCNAINNHYGVNNINEESLQTSEWVNTIASFFKQNPPPKQTASQGTTLGGMEGVPPLWGMDGAPPLWKKLRDEKSGSRPGTPMNTSNFSPERVRKQNNKETPYSNKKLAQHKHRVSSIIQSLQKLLRRLQVAEYQLQIAVEAAEYQLQIATDDQLQQAASAASAAVAEAASAASAVEIQLQQIAAVENQLQQIATAAAENLVQQVASEAAVLAKAASAAAELAEAAGHHLNQALGAAEAAEQANHHQRRLAGHTLNLLNAAVMLLYIHPELSFMECMRQAGIKLREPAKGKQGMDEAHEYNDEEGSTQKEDFSQNSATGLTADFNDTQTSPEYYNTLQYYENYKMLVNEFKIKVEDAKNATGDKDDGDGGDDPIPDCVPVLYIYDPSQELSGYIKTPEYTNDDIKIEYPTKDSGKKGNNNDESNYCFDHIAKCILCKRHQDKIKNGDTQLHIYVPKINKRTTSTGTTSTGTTSTGTTSTGTTSTGTYGGMLKRPKQRKTRKHNTKKKKRTIRKNKQHTKRLKRTFKKKSHKKSTKSQ